MSIISNIKATKQLVNSSCSSVMAIRLLVLGGTFVVATPLQPAYAQNVSFVDIPTQIVGTPVVDAEAPQIAVSGKNVYIVWHEPPTSTSTVHEVYFSRSTNRGADFSGSPGSGSMKTNISETPNTNSNDERIAASAGNVFVVWSEGSNEIWFRRSTNGGVTFKKSTKLSTAANAMAPQIAVSGKNVYVAWEADAPGGNKNIFFIQSSDTGATFDPLGEKNISDSNGAMGSSFQPHVNQIAVSGNHVIVTWRDDVIANAGNEIFFRHGQ